VEDFSIVDDGSGTFSPSTLSLLVLGDQLLF